MKLKLTLVVFSLFTFGANSFALANTQIEQYSGEFPVEIHQKSQPSLSADMALVLNARTGEVVYGKNTSSIASIASVTKLMTAMVAMDQNSSLNEMLTISSEEIDRLKGTTSRLSVGSSLPRSDIYWIALMSSENRAAHALSRYYPGGKPAFIAAMNQKARSLGMYNTKFYDPTGLDPRNQSTAEDLAKMVQAAYKYPLIRQYTTATEHVVTVGNSKELLYKNSNLLVREQTMDISLSKTGYISEAGRCLVMQATVGNEPMIMVFLNARSSASRAGDAKLLQTWLEFSPESNQQSL
ncbi:MAG: serine hydrolase [Neisseriaceae bacterium]|nr:serine hydrolase [Neisseriaceae bacterium]